MLVEERADYAAGVGVRPLSVSCVDGIQPEQPHRGPPRAIIALIARGAIRWGVIHQPDGEAGRMSETASDAATALPGESPTTASVDFASLAGCHAPSSIRRWLGD